MPSPWIMQTSDPHEVDIEYPANMVRRLTTSLLWDEGVTSLAAFKITERQAGAGFFIDHTGGEAFVDGDDETSQGTYTCELDPETDIVVPAAPGSNSRYDLVVLRVNDPQAGGASGSNCEVVVIEGVAASSPTVPATPDSAIALAVIGPITSSTGSITDSIIEDVRPLAGRKCTPGTIEWLAAANVPNGWLACDGSLVSRSTYARLFAHIGETYGAGDGSTTFKLPDLRGRNALARRPDIGSMDTIGETGGAYTQTLSEANLPAHVHGLNSHVHPVNPPPTGVTSSVLGYENETGSGQGFLGTASGGGTTINPGPLMSVDIAQFNSGGASGNTTSVGSGTAVDIKNPYVVVGVAVIRT